jgi:hypothetical protein
MSAGWQGRGRQAGCGCGQISTQSTAAAPKAKPTISHVAACLKLLFLFFGA